MNRITHTHTTPSDGVMLTDVRGLASGHRETRRLMCGQLAQFMPSLPRLAANAGMYGGTAA